MQYPAIVVIFHYHVSSCTLTHAITLSLITEDYINSHFSLSLPLSNLSPLLDSTISHHPPLPCYIYHFSIHSYSKMRVPLFLISLASIFILSHGSSEDVNNIQKVNNDFAVFFDDKTYSNILPLFTANATFNIFTKTRGNFTIRGGKEVVRIISGFTTYTTQISLTTQSYTLLPPFDSLGGASEATSVSAFNPAVFTDDKAQFFYAKLDDKYTKTPDFAQYGGWKIEQRSFILLVSFNHHRSRCCGCLILSLSVGFWILT